MTHELDNLESAARCQDKDSGQICSPSDDQQITRHLAELQAHIDRMPGDNRPQSPAEDSANVILSKLDRQTIALETLSGGLNQMHRQIAARVIDAIKELNLCVPAASPVEQESSDANSTVAEDSAAPVTEEQPAEEVPVAEPTAEPDPAESSWDRIRQSFLEATEEESAPEPEPEPVASTPAAEEPADIVSDAEPAADTDTEPPEPLTFEVPEPFDCSTIDDAALRAVFLEREEILRLMSLHLLRPQRTAAIPAEQLREIAETLPDDLRQRVELSLSRLDEQHRLTELELSLERARMARQKTSLEETRCRLENTARQMGYTVLEDGTLDGAQEVEDVPGSGRRWTKVLGFGR